MKKIHVLVWSAVLALCSALSCDNYERTQVVPTITVDHAELTLFEGQTKQLTASPTKFKFTWRSEDESIATVDATGLVTAVARGATSIVCSGGELSFKTEVVVMKRIPMSDFVFECDDLIELAVGNKFSIRVTTFPAEANDIDLTAGRWWSDDESVARVNSGGLVKAVGIGTTTIHYSLGGIEKTTDFTIDTSFPLHKGKPFEITHAGPNELWYRDFDRGGENVAFYDTGGGGGNTYRAQNGDPTSKKVTIEGGGNIGYLADGEWYVYSILVKEAGTYTLISRAGSGSNSWGESTIGRYHYLIDEVDVTGGRPWIGSGGWGNFKDSDAVDITLTAGAHKLKFYAEKGMHNPITMRFVYKP